MPQIFEKDNPSNIYLKIDTQGYDREVLKGASDSLDRISAIQTEMSVTAIYDGMPGYIEMLNFLGNKNFVPSGFFPVNPKPALQLIEFDCCLVNSNLLELSTVGIVDKRKNGELPIKSPV